MPPVGFEGDVRALSPLSSTKTRKHTLPRGAELLPDGSVRFCFWGPAAKVVHLEIDGIEQVLALQAHGDGWHELVTTQATVGSRYKFILPDGTRVPDPASRFQPHDIHGPSEVIDPRSHEWTDSDWHGRPWNQAVLYELHVGSFTDAGTFIAAIEKLDHLVELGITGIEIMPVADFPGGWNWGYDGALLYAPDSSYGRPEDLKRLVQEAHARGLMVILDVVYNHFGPDGNYLPVYAPKTFTSRHKTDWGDAVNYDGPESEHVREFAIHNALYWVNEFHLDGLRLDAVHAIKDDSAKHLLDELAERVREAAGDRFIHLILENEENQASRLSRDLCGRPQHYTAQWNDDMHHVLHTAATLESNGYYGDFKDDTGKLGRALAEGFAFQGQVMECTGKERGEPSAHLRPPHLCLSSKTMTRLETGPSANASTRSHPLKPCERSPLYTSCSRRFQCSLWVRNGVALSPFPSSATSRASWERKSGREGATNLLAFRNSRIQTNETESLIR